MIGIIGMGFVGSAVYANINSKDVIRTYDKYKDGNWNTIDEIKECDFIFVCVSTPQQDDGFVDPTNVQGILDELIDYKGIIILKSTIPDLYIPRRHNIVYNPEFLGERTNIEDFRNQTYIVLGGDIIATKKIQSMYYNYFNLPKIPKYEHCSIKEASDFKYVRNIKQAYNVMFWEYVQDTTGDARKLAQMMKNLPVGENSSVGMDGFRGIGGACLPKDLNAFSKEHGHILTDMMKEYNSFLKGFKP